MSMLARGCDFCASLPFVLLPPPLPLLVVLVAQLVFAPDGEISAIMRDYYSKRHKCSHTKKGTTRLWYVRKTTTTTTQRGGGSDQ